MAKLLPEIQFGQAALSFFSSTPSGGGKMGHVNLSTIKLGSHGPICCASNAYHATLFFYIGKALLSSKLDLSGGCQDNPASAIS